MNPHDTIVALATPPAPGGRAIVRLSGPDCAALLERTGIIEKSLSLPRALLTQADLHLPELSAAVPVDVYLWPHGRSATGQEMAEVHLISSMPIVESLIAHLIALGARAAGPGEFSMRAFLAGKLDLTRAEAVLGVIEADNRTELREALLQLAGGLERPLHTLRDDLLNLLADVEAGLDFTDEDIEFVHQEEMLRRLGSALAQVTLVGRQLDQRAVSDDIFRVVLAGRPNAGKSTLFNALTGGSALVSAQPGTTRDYLTRRIELANVTLELIDTAGWQTPGDQIQDQAQHLARQQAERANLILLCIEAGTEPTADESSLLAQDRVIAVRTKWDLQNQPLLKEGEIALSSVTGTGLNELRRLLADRASRRTSSPLAPSLSRCRAHVTRCLEHLRRAHAIVLEGDPPELLALELREALYQLGEMVGAVYTNDLLDRIFSRFCIGK